MSSRTDVPEENPVWGALPVEQYFLKHWDKASSLSDEDQRRELALAYIQEDVIGPDLDPAQQTSPGTLPIVPTLEEIREILEPWRPQKLRRIAHKYLTDSVEYCSFLRTYYDGGVEDDAKLHEWLADMNCGEGWEIEPEDWWWQVLDDAELFNVGDDFERVFETLPELAAPQPDRTFGSIDGVHSDIQEKKENHAIDGEPIEDDYEDTILERAHRTTLAILDEEAFQEGDMRLVFLDAKGNIVMDSSVKVEDLYEIVHYNTRTSKVESFLWLDGAVGKKYRTRGQIMKKLLDEAGAPVIARR